MLVVADTRRSVARLTPQEPENQPRALRATNLPGVPYILSMKSQENRKTVPANHMRDCALVGRSHLGSGTVPRHIATRRLILGCYFKLAPSTGLSFLRLHTEPPVLFLQFGALTQPRVAPASSMMPLPNSATTGFLRITMHRHNLVFTQAHPYERTPQLRALLPRGAPTAQ